jgi:hypothetical protein
VELPLHPNFRRHPRELSQGYAPPEAIVDAGLTGERINHIADRRTENNMKCFSALLLAALVVAAPSASADDVEKSMSFPELITVVVDHVPGTSAGVENILNATSRVQLGPRGWWHEPIDYRTRDGTLLHITLIFDSQNLKSPDVVRFMAVVDSMQCLDAEKLRDELAQTQHIAWASHGPLGAWSGKLQGRLVSVSQREGRCLASAIVDDRYQPRPIPPTVHRLAPPASPGATKRGQNHLIVQQRPSLDVKTEQAPRKMTLTHYAGFASPA